MNRYRKKPVVIEAIQFNGKNQDEILGMLGAVNNVDMHFEPKADGTMQAVLSIRTLEGSMTVSLHDWVIKGVKGEFYPCKPDIFDASYEPADQEVIA